MFAFSNYFQKLFSYKHKVNCFNENILFVTKTILIKVILGNMSFYHWNFKSFSHFWPQSVPHHINTASKIRMNAIIILKNLFQFLVQFFLYEGLITPPHINLDFGLNYCSRMSILSTIMIIKNNKANKSVNGFLFSSEHSMN